MLVFRGGLWGTDAEHLNPTTHVVEAEAAIKSPLQASRIRGLSWHKLENRRIYHGKSKCFAVFDGLFDMLITRSWIRMTGFQERNYD